MQQFGAVGVSIKNKLEGLVSMLFSSIHGCKTASEVGKGNVLMAKTAPEVARRLQRFFVDLNESFVAGLRGGQDTGKIVCRTAMQPYAVGPPE